MKTVIFLAIQIDVAAFRRVVIMKRTKQENLANGFRMIHRYSRLFSDFRIFLFDMEKSLIWMILNDDL